MFPNNSNEEDIDIVIDEAINDDDFEKSDIEIETCDSIEEFKSPQEYENDGIIILDGLNEKNERSSSTSYV